uniref:Uncharacterized protein LOC105115393 n=2 Tax=Rhizophora mucronata TaxID=61149 RepID=A0A2P2KDI1_RHIMU
MIITTQENATSEILLQYCNRKGSCILIVYKIQYMIRTKFNNPLLQPVDMCTSISFIKSCQPNNRTTALEHHLFCF